MLVPLAALALPIVISGAIPKAVEAQAAVTRDGRFVVVFGSGQSVYEAHETAPGSWAAPAKVADLPGLGLGMRRGPRVAVSGSTWLVTAPTGARMTGDLYAFVSQNEGKSWVGPARINDAPGKAPEGLNGLSAAPGGGFTAVWLDGRNKDTTLWISSSKDGVSWTKNKELYRSPSGSVCECCHPTVALSPQGEQVVFWRNSVGGFRDMFAGVLDKGTLAKSTKLGKGSWKLDACPMDGGALALAPSGNRFAVWRREDGVYLSDLAGGSEMLVGEGMQPWATAGTGDVWVCWLARRRGPLLATRFGSGKVEELAAQADDPVLASSSTRTLALWTGREGIYAQELR